jgi:hypothetical protein
MYSQSDKEAWAKFTGGNIPSKKSFGSKSGIVKSYTRKSAKGKPVRVKTYTRNSLTPKGKMMFDDKVHKTMHEFKMGTLNSYAGKGKTGKKVTSKSQALAIALSVAGRHTALKKLQSKKKS